MLELEPPRHTRLRSLVLRAFTSRPIDALRPEIEGLSHQLVDALPAGPFDLLQHFGQKLPVIIIARLLGVPESMAPDLLRWSNAMVKMYMAGRTPEMEAQAVAATQDFVAFMRGYVDARRSDPRDDLITHLIQAEEAGDRLSPEELVALVVQLIFAGHETTQNLLGNGLYRLLAAPDQLAYLRRDPAAIPDAIEEMLRYDPPILFTSRVARHDVEVAGERFRKGDVIGLLLGAANRDPARFSDPDRFDAGRTPNPHVSFGAGIHACVGAPLARLEMQVALRVLFARLPGMHVAEPPRVKDAWHFRGLESLRVAW